MRRFLSHQFLRFLLFSGMAAATNLGVGYLFYEIMGFNGILEYPIATGFAFLTGMSVSYLLNRRFTFQCSGRPMGQEMGRFFVVSLGGLVLTIIVAQFVRACLFPIVLSSDTVAQLVPPFVTVEALSHASAILLVAVYSFTCHHAYSFARSGHHGPGDRRSQGLMRTSGQGVISI
jgi:putative flippase GtrA